MKTRYLTIAALVAIPVLGAACGDADDPPARPAATARSEPPPQELIGTWVTKLRKRDAPAGLDVVNPFSVTIAPTGGVDDGPVFQIANGAEALEGETSLPVVVGDQITLRQEGCYLNNTYKFYDNVYSYEVSGDTLTFTLVKNSCKDRHAESILTSHPFKRSS